MILSSPARGHVIIHQAQASDRNFMRLPWCSLVRGRWPVAVVNGSHTKAPFPKDPAVFDHWFVNGSAEAGISVVADWREEARQDGWTS